MDFSVLTSLYIKARKDEFEATLHSIWDDQTLKPSEIVVVKDGPLPDELENFLDACADKYPLKFVRLAQASGLGEALRQGVLACSHEIIARMDGDDIAVSDRFEKQIGYMSEHPDVVLLGGAIQEFGDSLEDLLGKRVPPTDADNIRKFAKYRNPFNHMTVCFRKSAVLAAGNYVPLDGYEDYWLWCRMLADGGKGANLPEVLVYARAGADMIRRRRGWKLAKSEARLAELQHGIGFISAGEMWRNIFLKGGARLIPVRCLKLVYNFLRSK